MILPRRPDDNNQLLQNIPAPERARVEGYLSERHLARDVYVYRRDARIAEAIFPTTCVLSAIALLQDGAGVEIGTIGREGFGGIQLAMGVREVPSEMLCQVSGDAYAMDAAAFTACLNELPVFRAIVYRYTQSFLNAMGQSIACNAMHGVTQRCARWLLTTRDRVGCNRFFLTQEYLAYMLGVRRAGVSTAAGALQDAGLIHYRRGHIEILDAARLEAVACECYHSINAAYRELMGGDA